MKKRFGIFALALVLGCSIVTSSALAVSPVADGELDEIEVTATTRVFWIDEEGNRVLVEEDTELVDSVLVERDPSGEVSPQVVQYLRNVQYFKGFESGTMGCYINADFEYEKGNYVVCVKNDSGLYNIPSGWKKLDFNTYRDQAKNKRWATANYNVTMLTTGNQTRVYEITIKADYNGNVSKY